MVLAKTETTTSPTPDNLYSGQVHTQPLPVKAGTYVRGQVLELDAVTNKLQALTDPAKAFAVMVHSYEVLQDGDHPVYVWGEFNEDELEYNSQDVVATKLKLRQLGIFVRKFSLA